MDPVAERERVKVYIIWAVVGLIVMGMLAAALKPSPSLDQMKADHEFMNAKRAYGR